ncbi:MAG: hypothetical protein H6970_03090 [Gammaproteobacteria bacterium]|nr:hypothetical protein [Gammaproteobacteria bacterium]MCP5424043.1 hypothetical protein [Gammaproteobacteria bacterium]MCP5459523.1 hypothetical protein [Gammaproteobacteria bacterium]
MVWNIKPQNTNANPTLAIGGRRFDSKFELVPQPLAGNYRNGGGGPWFSPGFAIFPGPYKSQTAFPTIEGWKFHVTAPLSLEGARTVSLLVLPTLVALNVWHKLPKDFSALTKLYSSPHQQGKYITIYSMNAGDALAIVKALRPIMPKYNLHGAPLPPNDKRVIGLSSATCRYGAFSGNKITDPRGQLVNDDRTNPPAWAWAQCPVALRN